MDPYPHHRQLQPPLTAEQLTPLGPLCKRVQFCDPFSTADFRLLAEFMSQYPQVTLRCYGDYELADLRFLEYFPFLRSFAIDVFEIRSFAGLECLSPELEYLHIGPTRSKAHSLYVLASFAHLKELSLESQTKHIDSISGLSELEQLTLRSITLPDLSILTPLRKLWSLGLKLGGTNNLALLPEVGQLLYLELWMVRGLTDLSPIADLTTLEYLFIQALKHVTVLPSMKKLKRLRRIHLETMHGLSDLSPLLEAPALETLTVGDARHLEPKDFVVLGSHPTLRNAVVSLGSLRKNAEVHAILSQAGIEELQPFAEYRLSNGAVCWK